MKVLWLASWYPDEYEPVNGDFIQRHAKAVARTLPVDVIHVTQAGKDFAYLNNINERKDGNLHETIYYFHRKKTGIEFLDKVLYNYYFLRYYKRVVKKYIAANEKPDLIHVHVPLKAGMVAWYFLKRYNIPYIVSEHSSLYLKEARDSFATRSFFFRYNTAKVYKHAALVTNVSVAIGKVLQQLFSIKKLVIIPNVVDTTYFNHQQKEPNKMFRWLHVSSLIPLKNVEGIIEAFKNLSVSNTNWELILCGPLNTSLQQLVISYGLQQQIKFTGELSYEMVAKQMQQADAFVLFSKHENFPCVIIEALCCGLPVVATNVGGVSEAVNNSNGLLVEPGDIAALEKALKAVMQKISDYSPVAISSSATKKYNYHAIAQQFLLQYKNVLQLT